MVRKLAVLSVLLLAVATVASAQVAIPNYARAAFQTWLNSVLSSGWRPPAYISGLASNGKMLPLVVCESIKLGQANALVCTLDFDRPVYAPFLCASAATVTGSIRLFNEYNDATPSTFTNGTDTMAFGLPVFARRIVFSAPSADTPCAFYVVAFPVATP